jgi:hypothetical protein
VSLGSSPAGGRLAPSRLGLGMEPHAASTTEGIAMSNITAPLERNKEFAVETVAQPVRTGS